MPRRQNRAQQHNENRYQNNRDKQYKQFIGVAQAISKSLEQSNVFDFDASHYTLSTSESSLTYSSLRFDTTQKCLLGLLLLTVAGSLIPRANAMPTIDVNDTNSLVSNDRFTPSVNATEIIPLQLNTQVSQDRKRFSNKASQSIGLFRHRRKSVVEVEDSIEEIYCSSQLNCTTKSDVKSCNFNSDKPQYWDRIGDSGDSSNVVVGVYNFYYANTAYHASRVGFADCLYANTDSGKILSLYSQTVPNLEAFYNSSTKWNIEGEWAECRSASPQACPLKEAQSLAIFNNNTTEFVSVTANGIQLLKYPVGSTSSAVVRYEDALSGCYTSDQCVIDFSTDSKGIIGGVLVDMNNAMKILRIISLPYLSINTSQINPYNTVELKKIDNPPASNSSVIIFNNINSDIEVSGDDGQSIIDKSISSRTNGSVFFERAVSHCRNATGCKISIQVQHVSVGSVTVDVSNNMKVLAVDSVRSSEIEIKKSNFPNSVEVDYPNSIPSMRRR